ncbi:MAG: hypothetical protein ACI9XO_004498, partial [Paraglaciecola sp.]
MNIQIQIQNKKWSPENMIIYSKKGSIYLHYEIDSIDYFFENQRFLFLIDTNLSKDKETIICHKLAKLNDLDVKEISKIFNGNYFMFAIDKRDAQVHLLRDVSGVKTGYFTQTENGLIIGSIMHDVARKRDNVTYNKEAIGQLLYSNYLLNGFTIYEEIEEVKMGQCLTFDFKLDIAEINFETIKLAQKDNDLSPEENFQKLRKETQKAHQGYICKDNQVFLSGGLDSIAMLVALDDLEERKNINTLSFRVKDTNQDETVYAQSIAQYLTINNEIKEVDANDIENVKNFEERILKMNNPYFGMWIFGNFDGTPDQMFYAGQDTRLHTPALNEVDKLAFNLLKFQKAWWMKYLAQPAAKTARFLMEKLGWHKKGGMILGNLYKATHIFDLKKYVQKFYLKLDKEEMAKKGIPTDYYNQFQKHFDFDLDKIETPRALYNKLVELKWQEQYTFDMRYLQDVARVNNTYIAMPFYDKKLAEYSSSIPFDLATKAMKGRSRFGKTSRIIYKYVLRQAFRDKLNDLVFYRAKAVSETLHQLFNGALGAKVRMLLRDDLKAQDSFIKSFKLENYVKRFLNKSTFKMSDYDLLARV